jgi:drug/metabolite transporter (DMT)-like permease
MGRVACDWFEWVRFFFFRLLCLQFRIYPPYLGDASRWAGQGMLNRGLQLERAGTAASMNYLQIVWAFVIDTIAMHNAPAWTTVVGAFSRSNSWCPGTDIKFVVFAKFVSEIPSRSEYF